MPKVIYEDSEFPLTDAQWAAMFRIPPRIDRMYREAIMRVADGRRTTQRDNQPDYRRGKNA